MLKSLGFRMRLVPQQWVGVFILLMGTLFPLFADAAVLRFSPASGSQAVNRTFTVGVFVLSPDQAMNAGQGVISFSPEQLEATSVSKNGSIFNFWVQEPSFSNTTGTVNFEGVVLNPGYRGTNGKVLSVTFRPKRSGPSLLTFSSASVLANDGKGTNILADLENAQFAIAPADESPAGQEERTPSVLVGAPEAPNITSETHPDSTRWYSLSAGRFQWPIPSDVIAVRTLLSRLSGVTPSVVYDPPIDSKVVSDIPDGMWYFHAQFRNRIGWGKIAHFHFQVDTAPPRRFSVTFPDGNSSDTPRIPVFFFTTDELSGLSHYELKIEGEDSLTVPADKIKSSSPFLLPLQSPGKKTLIVKAIDKAGNATDATAEFTVQSIDSPTITRYQKTLTAGKEILRIEGKTYPEGRVSVFLQNEKNVAESEIVTARKDGSFELLWPHRLPEGVYTLFAQVEDARGAKSNPSEHLRIAVEPDALFRIGWLVITYFSLFLLLVILIVGLVTLAIYGWHRFQLFKKRLRKEITEADRALHKAFDLLKEDIREQIKMLEKVKGKRQLTQEEEKILKQFGQDLEEAERFVKKEIHDIEQELK